MTQRDKKHRKIQDFCVFRKQIDNKRQPFSTKRYNTIISGFPTDDILFTFYSEQLKSGSRRFITYSPQWPLLSLNECSGEYCWHLSQFNRHSKLCFMGCINKSYSRRRLQKSKTIEAFTTPPPEHISIVFSIITRWS